MEREERMSRAGEKARRRERERERERERGKRRERGRRRGQDGSIKTVSRMCRGAPSHPPPTTTASSPAFAGVEAT